MKKVPSILLALLAPIVLWLAAPFLAYYPSWIYSQLDKRCQAERQGSSPRTTDECKEFLSIQGQSGDLYGMVTSLFSGLALFGVVYTLHSDLRFRRREKKPLVVCGISESADKASPPEWFFDKPTDGSPGSFYLIGNFTITSVAETALRVKVKPMLVVDGKSFTLGEIPVSMPLQANVPHKVKLSDILSKDAVDAICGHRNYLPLIKLRFVTSCTNLEDERFESTVEFDLALLFVDSQRKILSRRHGENEWIDGSSVALNLTLVANSWNSQLIPN